jgi:DNA-binding MarR family transcriptional regulator
MSASFRYSFAKIGGYQSNSPAARGEPSLEATYGIADNCVGLHLQFAGRAVARRFDAAFRPLALTGGQFAMMLTLHRAAPINVSDLAGHLLMDRSTATANLKPLERRNLVRSVPYDTDRRARLLTLTTAGRAALANAIELWAKANDLVTRGLSKNEMRALCQTLRRISAIHQTKGRFVRR